MKRGFGAKSGSLPSNKRPLLFEQLNLEHPLVKLSQAIDWGELEQEFSQPITGEGGRLHQQQPKDSGKLYSVHAPEVECIAKGKIQKRYEFGCKVVLTTTNSSNWIVGIDAVHDNPYDGSTLKQAIAQTERLTAIKPNLVFVDKGYRGTVHHPPGVEVFVCGTRQLTGALKRWLKRRSAIEAVIGHSKQDHALGRNYLHGQIGDRINAFLVGCGFNLRKLFHFFLTNPLIVQANI